MLTYGSRLFVVDLGLNSHRLTHHLSKVLNEHRGQMLDGPFVWGFFANFFFRALLTWQFLYHLVL
jgi:hypothetical protein